MANSTPPRTSLADRLGNLFSDFSRPLSRSSSPNPEMLRILPAASSSNLLSIRPNSPISCISLQRQPSQLPVVQWVTSHESESESTQLSPLEEAMSEDTFTPSKALAIPPSARLPPSFIASRTVRPPMLLDSLTKSTLPTSSLARPQPSAQLMPEASGSIIRSRPETHTSLQSLQLINRRMHTSAPAEAKPSPPASRWWFQEDNKLGVDQVLGEEDQATTVEEEEGKIRRKYLSPKNPVVFCHGLFGFDSIQLGLSAFAPLQISHWRGIKEVLEANGIEVLITRVPATSSIDERAKVLQEKIEEVYENRDVHLIGHSMGGLDCRYMVSKLPIKFRVLSVTTLATPHRGSAFADYFLSTIGRDRIPSVVSLANLTPIGGGDGKAFESLTLDAMRVFNENTPDKEGVKYFSWGAMFEPGLLDTFKFPHSVIVGQEGPNDGLVSVESSKWGTYLGTLEDVSHLDLVGWVNTARYKWAEFTGKEIKFKPATFYLGIASTLAKEVEGITDPDDKAGPSLNMATFPGDSDKSKPDVRGSKKGKQKAVSEDDTWDSSSIRSASPDIE